VTAHPLRGSTTPAATLEQVPKKPGTLQAVQSGQEAEPQHTPSRHVPDWHSPLAAQAAPSPFFWHTEPAQVKGATQSALVAHPSTHAAPRQPYGAHSMLDGGAVQLPDPSQNEAGTSMLPEQAAALQTVPGGWR
jgi:hypothetical protein